MERFGISKLKLYHYFQNKDILKIEISSNTRNMYNFGNCDLFKYSLFSMDEKF